MISTITKTVQYLTIEISKAPNTLQQSSYLSAMYKTNNQLINLFQQCCLKIEHYFSWIIIDTGD